MCTWSVAFRRTGRGMRRSAEASGPLRSRTPLVVPASVSQVAEQPAERWYGGGGHKLYGALGETYVAKPPAAGAIPSRCFLCAFLLAVVPLFVLLIPLDLGFSAKVPAQEAKHQDQPTVELPRNDVDREASAQTAPASDRELPVAVGAQPDDIKVAAFFVQAANAPQRATADQSLGRQLYLRHCAGCHGERGDGNGIAARQLMPRPRNFRTGRFRLVSTSNNVPTREDLRAVLLRGMPGSSMVPWPQLSEADRDAVIDEVLRLRREGTLEQYVLQLKEQEGLTDEELKTPEIQQDIQRTVDQALQPGAGTSVPSFPPATADSIARGRQWYVQFGCVPCHGEQGRGDGIQKMLDDDQLPTRPRDFTAGIFKGRDDPASLYRRIAYGMPGTPMPGSSQMTPEQMVELVQYILSLSTPEQRAAAVLNRETIAARRVARVPPDPRQVDWDSVPEYVVRLTPLWWRDAFPRNVAIQVVHDQTAVALRLRWQDATRDEQALRHESFADAVAVEWCLGDREPFLGMGSAEEPVDVWYWNARREGSVTLEDIYPRTVVDSLPFHEAVAETAEGTRNAVRSTAQPPLSLPAQAVDNRIVPGHPIGDSGGLAAAGPGTLSFRLTPNRHVTTAAHWADGTWTVWMRRSLRVDSDAGLTLQPQMAMALAIAVWDGSYADRNGQKVISLWQPVVLP